MAMTPARRRPPPVESTPDPTPPPMLGHNRPRPPTPEEIRELLLDECAELLRRRDELLAGAERFDKANAVITSDEIAGKAADFAATKGAMGQFLARAETNRTTSKEPYLAGSRVVDAWFASLVTPIKQAQQQVMSKVTAYLRAEEDRKRAEAQALAVKAAADAARAEQQAMRSMKPAAIDQAAEAAARAEAAERAAKAKQDTRVVGDLGASVGLRGTWKIRRSRKQPYGARPRGGRGPSPSRLPCVQHQPHRVCRPLREGAGDPGLCDPRGAHRHVRIIYANSPHARL
jgi:hypothetical protein